LIGNHSKALQDTLGGTEVTKMSKHNSYNFDEEVRKALDGQEQEPDNLRCLYTEYSARMRNKGAHIWIIGAFLMTISVSGIAVLDFEKSPEQTVVVAIPCILLALTWLLISEALRARLNRDRAICDTIEAIMLKRELPLSRSIAKSKRLFPLSWIRRLISLVIIGIWVTVVVVRLK
jgi:hypothetical protein